MDQVRNMMLVTVFVFIGIEGASVYSGGPSALGRGQGHGDRAFSGCWRCWCWSTCCRWGHDPAGTGGLQNPSLASVLEHIVGPGALLISIGLAVSLLGALLSWALLCAEILFATARTRPCRLPARENANHVPANALWLTNVMIQGSC
jgi:arginine:ornithine antiporter/lysine permease